jgi:hypothetical protein
MSQLTPHALGGGRRRRSRRRRRRGWRRRWRRGRDADDATSSIAPNNLSPSLSLSLSLSHTHTHTLPPSLFLSPSLLHYLFSSSLSLFLSLVCPRRLGLDRTNEYKQEGVL